MDCPLCTTPTEFLTEAAGRPYHHCPVCRLISVPPEFHLLREAEIARYREHENSLDNPGYVNMFMEKIRCIETFCSEIHSALDFGCGYEPVLVTLLNREGYHAEGYDALFFPDWPEGQSFDLVISTETFEHLKLPGQELRRIEPMIRPGGYLAVMTQYYPEGREQPDTEAFQKWYYQRDPTHICFYRQDTFQWIAGHFAMRVIYDNGKDFAILQKP